ncbi:unnamed protein product, partial [Trichobilharzia regenti]
IILTNQTIEILLCRDKRFLRLTELRQHSVFFTGLLTPYFSVLNYFQAKFLLVCCFSIVTVIAGDVVNRLQRSGRSIVVVMNLVVA